MNGNGKPKLELEINKSQVLKLLQNEPAQGTSSYGPWWLYNVESDGKEMSFFAPEPVVKYIEDNHLKKGDEISIIKTLVKDGKKNVPEYKIEIVSEQKEAVDEKITPPTNGNGKTDDIKIMRECLIAAIDLQKELGSVVDVNKVGLSLYISKTKNGNYQF
ncbi:MAG TPA: hypothetical protein VIL99_08285 [Ignavibacteria bacterium]